jgi:hypothetical protein
VRWFCTLSLRAPAVKVGRPSSKSAKALWVNAKSVNEIWPRACTSRKALPAIAKLLKAELDEVLVGRYRDGVGELPGVDCPLLRVVEFAAERGQAADLDVGQPQRALSVGKLGQADGAVGPDSAVLVERCGCGRG